MRHSIAAAFDADAATYDAARRQLVPCFDDFYGAIGQLIEQWQGPEQPEVLDLGAGTGLVAALIHGMRPRARLHLVDSAAAMLAVAQRRLSGATPRVTVADLAGLKIEPGRDLIVSALAIHHLNDEIKRDLYARVLAALKPGGLFINAEQVLGPTPEIERYYDRMWESQARRLGATSEIIASARTRMSFDRCAPVGVQLAWLRELGFNQVDCTYKAGRFAVLTGRRPS
jgi:ubiquinone/menaquinone biosynthesis C-methylase UbiE